MVKHSVMVEGTRTYHEDYDTDEYEKLICECHHEARCSDEHRLGRKPFRCVYCKAIYKNKNKLNLHRIVGCKAVTGDGSTVMKMYPVFGKGQKAEMEDILIKHGYMEPRKGTSRSKLRRGQGGRLSKLEDTDIEGNFGNEDDVKDKRHMKSRKWSGKILDSHEGSRTKQFIVLHESHDTEEHKVHETIARKRVRPPGVARNPMMKQPIIRKKSKNTMEHEEHEHGKEHTSSTKILDSVDPKHGQAKNERQESYTREHIEAEASRVATTMTSDVFVGPCPEQKHCPGLWHLLNFRLLPEEFPKVYDDNFLPNFREFVDSGSMDDALRRAFGTWYMEQESEADTIEKQTVHLTMKRFKEKDGGPDITLRDEEVAALSDYIGYLRELQSYEERKASADRDLHLKREYFVKEKLREFDEQEHLRIEHSQWHWSPLYASLKVDGVEGLLPGPWTHSEAEFHQLANSIMMNRRSNFEIAPTCPLILRVFRIMFVYCFEKCTCLACPSEGLTHDTLLGYVTSSDAPQALHNAAKSLLEEGYFIFGNMPDYPHAESEVQQDMESLLMGTQTSCNEVINKVQGFLRSVRQRAIGDMAQLHPILLQVLWCGGEESAICEAVIRFMHILKCREDLDLGLLSYPPEHSDCKSIDVSRAREAARSALEELHQQRLKADKERHFFPASQCRDLSSECDDYRTNDDKIGGTVENIALGIWLPPRN